MTDQIYVLLAWIVVGVAVLIAVSALFVDQVRQIFRKRRRCPRCWYDMSHTPGLTCSECGYKAKREEKLFKGRRRWRYVCLAIVMLLGSYALHVTPAVKAHLSEGVLDINGDRIRYCFALLYM